jgi:hypothetical protein
VSDKKTTKRDTGSTQKKEENKAKTSTSLGLAALALLSFAVAFFSARLFAVLNPKTIVEAGGIHFHHFWYGLVMIVVSGWLGISQPPSIYRRIYAIVFGLGAGLVADELGLLLTFGNYFSEPTYLVFIAAVCVGGLGVMLLWYRESVRYDFLDLKRNERILYAGVILVGVAVIPFAAGQPLLAGVIAAVGVVVIVVSIVLMKRDAV